MPKVAWFSTDWARTPVPDLDSKPNKPTFHESRLKLDYGGTYYYRMALPAAELENHGYECCLAWDFKCEEDGRISVLDVHGVWHDDCDIVMFQRWMFKDAENQAKRAIACGQIIINDIDDNFWALPKSNMAWHSTHPDKHPDNNRNHYKKMVAASSAITTSTNQLADQMSRKGPPVYICKNSINLGHWQPHDVTKNGMIGWIGGIPWRGNDLPILRNVLPDFLKKYDLPFYHGGDSPDPAYPKAWQQLGIDLEVTQVYTRPICPIQDYPSLWQNVNLSLIPLEDCTFNRSKSWLKALESSANAIPFIASDLPEQRMFCDGRIGRLAKTPQDWLNHLEDLTDPNVRVREGLANRARAEELSIDKQWVQWDNVFKELL